MQYQRHQPVKCCLAWRRLVPRRIKKKSASFINFQKSFWKRNVHTLQQPRYKVMELDIITTPYIYHSNIICANGDQNWCLSIHAVYRYKLTQMLIWQLRHVAQTWRLYVHVLHFMIKTNFAFLGTCWQKTSQASKISHNTHLVPSVDEVVQN